MEDHAPTREAVQSVLAVAGAEVLTAGTGAEALTLLQRCAAAGQPVDLTLLDLQLPDSDALALAHEIHAQPALQGARLILLSPIGQRLEPSLLRTVGLSGYVVKPVKRSRLLEILLAVHRGDDAVAAAQVVRDLGQATRATLPLGRKPLRILIAEDNLVNRKVALKLLGKLGYTAEVAGNGREALSALASQPFDVVLMDCQMPELDGYETTRTLRREEADGTYGSRPPHFVIALTANAMAGDREKCLAAGMDDFITKPIELSQLEAALHRAEGSARPGETTAAQGSGNEERPDIILDTTLLDVLRVPDDPAALKELVDLFREDAPRRLDALKTAVAAQDLAASRIAAHSAKGSAANLGGRRFAALAGKAETATKNADWNLLQRLVPELERELEILFQALDAAI